MDGISSLTLLVEPTFRPAWAIVMAGPHPLTLHGVRNELQSNACAILQLQPTRAYGTMAGGHATSRHHDGPGRPATVAAHSFPAYQRDGPSTPKQPWLGSARNNCGLRLPKYTS